MALSGKQAYVLDHLIRVTKLPYKLQVHHPSKRYQLDGWECTAQITGLVVRRYMVEHSNGQLERINFRCTAAAAFYR